MVLEATMICIDNSEWMRNGDYFPSRLDAQADAVSLLCGAKTQSNPENTVGVLAMAGTGKGGARVLVTPTGDLGKILACTHGSLELGGAEADLAAAIQVAQLALKHRQNKRQQQRIVAFVGGPVTYDKEVLETIGKKLKKNNVALDVVDFGESDDGKAEKLEALVAAVNGCGSSSSSHIVHVPPGENALSDVLLSTPIFTGEEEGSGSGFAASAAAASAAAAAAAAGASSGFEFGVDPNVDPELALALRLSMEEERARQEAIAKKAAEDTSSNNASSSNSNNSDSVMAEAEPANAAAGGDKKEQPKDDDDDLLQQALAMSMEGGAAGSAAVSDSAMAEADAIDPDDLALALQMSVEDANMSSDTDMSKVFQDTTFVSSILNSLPGVDPNDPSVKDLLASLHGQGEQEKKEDKSDKTDDEKN